MVPIDAGVTTRRAITRTRVRFGETDAAGIVYYPTFFTWFDLGTHTLIREGDTPAHDAEGRPIFPLPIVECGATFLAPLFFDEPIAIISNVAHIGVSSVRVEHEIRHQETLAARGFEVRVFVDASSGRIAKAPLPAALRDRLQSALTVEVSSG